MKKYIVFSIIVSFTFLSTLSFAQDLQGANNQKKSWDEEYVNTLAKIKNPDKTDGLGYTLSIFNSEAKIDLEQLCLCATETGDSSIPKSIMVKAANDAVANNKIRRDEVTQAQCLQQGLGFTVAQNAPDPINPVPKQPSYSPF